MQLLERRKGRGVNLGQLLLCSLWQWCVLQARCQVDSFPRGQVKTGGGGAAVVVMVEGMGQCLQRAGEWAL